MLNRNKKVIDNLPDDPRLKTVKQISKLMDEQFEIGGFKFGLDPILNLFPVAGDVGGYFVSIALIITMMKHGASGKVALKMAANATLDAVVGTIPLIGWIFDFGYKANMRNVKLLAEHYVEGKHQGKAGPMLGVILLVFFIVIIAITYVGIKVLAWLIRTVDNSMGVTF